MSWLSKAIGAVAQPVLSAVGGSFGGPIGAALGGAVGSAFTGNQQRGNAAAAATSAGQQGAAAAQYRPVNFNSPFGSMTNTASGQNYSMSPTQQGQYTMFGNMAKQAGGLANTAGGQIAGAGSTFNNLGNQYATGANAYGSAYHQAGLDALNAYKGFNQQGYANNAYNQMSALAAPQNTSDTQNLFSNLQKSGRLGLTQNGELGDIGGLALSQATADNQRRLQAEQLGLDTGNALANRANAFGQQGLDMTQGYGQLGNQFAQTGTGQQNDAVTRYGALNTTAGNNASYGNHVSDPMFNFAQIANQRAGGQAAAGGIQGGFLADAQNNRNNINGAYNGGLNSQLSGVYGDVGNQVGGWLGNYFNRNSGPDPNVIQSVSGPGSQYYGGDQQFRF